MQIRLPFSDALTNFTQLIVLASVLSIFCTSLTEVIKNLFADRFCNMRSSCMIAVAGAVSIITGILWPISFSDEITFGESLWLGVILWLGSQGFFIALEESESGLGKYFRSLSELKDNGNGEEIPEVILPDIPNADMFCYPVNYIAISEPFLPPEHYGTDFGWNRNYGGENQTIIASFSGIVDMAGYYDGGAGNMVRIYFDDKENDCRWYGIYKHLSKISVSKGDSVEKSDIIGNMGSTGDSTGNHLHFDLIKAPYGYSYTQTSSDRAKYSVDPLKYIFAYPSQTVGDETDKKYEIKRIIES